MVGGVVVVTEQPPLTALAVRLRRAAWVGLAVVSAARVLTVTPPPDSRGFRLVAEFAYVVPILLAFVGALLAWRRCWGAERRFWRFLAATLGLIVLSESYFSYYTLSVDAAGPKAPASFQLLQLGAIAIFFAMVVNLSRFDVASRVAKARFFTGATAGLVAVFVATLEFLVAPLFERVTGVSQSALVVCALYPTLGLAVLVAVFGVLFGVHSEKWRPWERFTIASLALYALGLTLMPFWYRSQLTDTPLSTVGALTDLGLSIGPYLLLMATVYRLTSDEPADALAPGPRLDEAPGWLRLVYPVVLAMLVLPIGLHALSHRGETHATVLLVSAILLAALLMLRSLLASVEVLQHEELTTHDPLTGLDNERSLLADLPVQVSDAKRYGGELALVVLDIDDLTRANDLFGHSRGDDVIKDVAAVLRAECRERYKPYRVGSDEFALAAPGMDAERAAVLARELCARVEEAVDVQGLATTLSGGVTSLDRSPEPDSLIADGLTALQSAKILHRGSVEVYVSRMVIPGPDERLELARKESYLSTVRALAAAVDARDPASREHSRRVGRLARRLGEALGFDAPKASALETAGLVHDIGKLALPDELLWKHGCFSEDEQARVREHVELGEQILRSTELAFLLPWVRSHHERWDGAGYPDGLCGEAIPLESRIIAVCDSFDALVSGMTCETPLSVDAALQEIDLGIGRHFDPEVAEAFIRLQEHAVPPTASASSG